MDDLEFKRKYQKYKLRVKQWEKDFKRIHGRIPSKYDIKEAAQEIRDAYKMYYKLKTSFLETTLNDVLSEDGFDVFEMSQANESISGEIENLDMGINGGPQLPLDISAIISEGTKKTEFSNVQELVNDKNVLGGVVNLNDQHIIKNFEAVEESKQNAQAWGSAVSHTKSENTKKESTEKKTLKSNLSQKLFNSSSFSKRNPRKSLSRMNSDLFLRERQNTVRSFESGEPQEILPDMETILIQKAKEQQVAAAIIANPLLAGNKQKEPVKMRLDEGWLNRTAAQNGFEGAETFAVRRKLENTDTPVKKHLTYGLSNLDMSKIEVQINQVENESEKLQKNESLTPKVKATSALIGKDKRTDKSDSDSVVSESDEECASQQFRQVAKRRRLTLSSQQSQETPAVKMQTTPPTNKSNEKTEQKTTSPQLDSTKSEFDFSADDDKDEDYVLAQKKSKKPRGKAVVKRAKPKKKESNSTEEKPKRKAQRKTTKSAPSKRAVRGKNSKNDLKVVEVVQEEEGEHSSEPPNPETLKFALALDNVDIVCTPRVHFSELQQADDVAKDYINTIRMPMDGQPTRPSPNSIVDAKRAAARKKLEEKIATGKLNENYVTINIQKKKFSRGKKTINYSKYKKSQWKDKKRVAALTGPDMDMRGCDGGVLTCFACGGTGHFARQCKVKGDTLLPLTAQLAEDPSPFPTLEEAQRMAEQSAIAVHSRNIEKLPIANNLALFNAAEGKAADDGNSEDDANSSDENVEANEDEEFCIDSDDELNDLDVDAAIENANANANAVVVVDKEKCSPIKQYAGHKIPAEFLKRAGLDGKDIDVTARNNSGALYKPNDDGSVADVTPEVLDALRMFGHTSFRKGQDRAIMRILSGLSTLVTLSTGSGKSLCYQLPAYIYSRQRKSITLVISPLVSLMEDQVHGVPHFLRAYCLHTNQTPQKRQAVLEKIKNGEIDILLVSPEAVVSGERSTGFGSILRELPPIAFACIDEAHCVSQWSHNFRPSYLMICKVLKKNLGVNTVLGLTATATLPTRISIINHLGIADGERGVISDIPLPDNLILSVSKDENRDAALLLLLNKKRFEACQSVIIYCTRRDECERIASYLRTAMQDRKRDGDGDVTVNNKRKRKRFNWQAEPYHAGMPSSRRLSVQNAFMRNELRIVVATIAFGMGINKPDIRAVIHYNMPRNFESYVQEVGRAGRDGKIAHCHLFLDAHGNDQSELRRHIYANSIDRHVIRKLLRHVFVRCACDGNGQRQIKANSNVENDRICAGHEIAFSIEQTVAELDIPEENIHTLLCYMELDSRWCINIYSSAYAMAKVISYGGAKYLKHAAKECPPLAMAIAAEIKQQRFKEDANIIEFSVVDIASAIGWNSGVVKHQLKNLEWLQVNGQSRRSPITVTFYDLGFRLKAPGDFTTEEIDDALDTLYDRSVKQEHTQLIQLQYVYQGLSSVAYDNYMPCAKEDFSELRSDQLKGIIRNYFRNDYPKDMKLEVEPNNENDNEFIVDDVYKLINMYPENNFSGRNVARIFHGISSPNYPAVVWGRCKYWRAHTKHNFNRIVQLANEVIVKRRM